MAGSVGRILRPRRTVWLTILGLAALLAGATFVSAPHLAVRGENQMRHAKGHGILDNAVASIEDRVEALQEASLKECMKASDGDADALERCRSLSYELSIAEQLMLFRRRSFRYVESDSF
eukprot:CAMPEP_0197656140 /NCGR_PEP_ID=MMETSP1338-20131121/40467_1 /TAXON_ID=43686 ORGANISM="Pelagodinium beii, Strain RCC1491" /NCGR_SAMPLE_ID=MMETSP1338 /ASSEMBLY_ACC=CAM_ASM_000754 /LENGTH=119 /DNA_ID=CAMNT_0043231995 /DNA_START=82 /DNA_END=441 /DNA_ORIENTATION=+